MAQRGARTALAVALLVEVVLTSCSGTPRSDSSGAVAEPQGQRAQCVVADAQGELIVQPGSLRAGPDGLSLQGVALDDAVGIEAVESDTVPFAGRSTIQGVVLDYPPRKNAGLADSLADWAERRPLSGLRLTPADGQQAVLVALRLSEPHEPGHLDGVTLGYLDGDGPGTRALAQPLLVKPHGEPCTVDDVDSTMSWAPAA